MRTAYKANATHSAVAETPTWNTHRQATCIPANGSARSQSMRSSFVGSAGPTGSEVSIQRRNAPMRGALTDSDWVRGMAFLGGSRFRIYGRIPRSDAATRPIRPRGSDRQDLTLGDDRAGRCRMRQALLRLEGHG